MRLMHLSDLHLGKTVNGFSMLEDQEYILKQILEIAEEREVDAVLLCGDIYDRPVPPEEAVRLFDRFLTALAQREMPVFIISGNHDSAQRLAFGAHLMKSDRIYLAGVLEGTPQPITLGDAYGLVDFYLLPFVKPVNVRHAYRRKDGEKEAGGTQQSSPVASPISLLQENEEESEDAADAAWYEKQLQSAGGPEGADNYGEDEAEAGEEQSGKSGPGTSRPGTSRPEAGGGRSETDPETLRTYQDALAYVIGRIETDPERRSVILAHQFVTGAVRSESETINVGGTDNIDASLFDRFDYAALGHIHRPQQVGRPQVRYCGTPLKYSFSEAGQEKSVTLVDLREKGNVEIETVPLHPLRDLREIRGSYDELTLRKNYIDTDTEDYLHITLTDEEDILDVMTKLRTIYPNIMKLDYDNARTAETAQISASEETQQKTPLELIREFYQLQNNQELNAQQEAYVRRLLEEEA